MPHFVFQEQKMPVITLPDGSQRSFDHAVSVAEVAQSIGAGLARAALAGKVDGRLVDAAYVMSADAQLAIVTDRDAEGLDLIRHSTAHLLAYAVKELFPEAQVTIGPVIENGFYYDFSYKRPFTPEDLLAIEKRMAELAKLDLPVTRRVLPRDEAVAYFKHIGEHYKAEIIASIPADQDVSLYSEGEFTDLCRGPHVPSTGKLKAFKLMSVAGAYWKGQEGNPQMQRIYGVCFANQQQLDEHLHRLEEAKKRDHRRLGPELDLFSIQEEAGPGLIFWHPKGGLVRKLMEDWLRNELLARGYDLVFTPHIMLKDLWATSGHTNFYKENMFGAVEVEKADYQLKPMNCPGHILIYKSHLRSYRELPVRLAELGTVYRYERSGVLHGLLRVRGFTQDDAHIFCMPEQIESEIEACVDFAFATLKTFGFSEYVVELSEWDPAHPENYAGKREDWERATNALVNTLQRMNVPFKRMLGEAAFYGPKIDIKLIDAIGRPWQLTTVQFDFNLPPRFGLEYVGEDGARHQPLMVHRALWGSVERFFGVLIEHYAGAFPPWLAPVRDQVHQHPSAGDASRKRLGQRNAERHLSPGRYHHPPAKKRGREQSAVHA